MSAFCMNITIVGSGYVGLVTAACLADMGHRITCLDVDSEKIALLRQGHVPFHEPGLEDLVRKHLASSRLDFTDDAALACERSAVQILAVGTPPDEDGQADLQHVLAAARSIAHHMQDDKLVITKSTVPVGTGDLIAQAMQQVLDDRACNARVDVASNPEFLREGAAIHDFCHPHRIIAGTRTEAAAQTLREIFSPMPFGLDRIVWMDIRSAELTKYAANVMLATRIGLMNEFARLSEHLGADVELVRQGIGQDPRIGPMFLQPGCGFGGSCFPKDVRALASLSRIAGLNLPLIQSVESSNNQQKTVLVDKLLAHHDGQLQELRVGLWGLAFKPETDDMREAPARAMIDRLLAKGARIRAYDPIAGEQARRLYAGRAGIDIVATAAEAFQACDALLIATEWAEFKTFDWRAFAAAQRPRRILDGRNIYDPKTMEALGIVYECIGRGAA
jgi:UDPglucose 6-dehydrogenase